MKANQHKDNSETGQVMILTAILLTVFIISAAFAIDGGFGLFQSRQAQNAADFASLAASKLTPCNSGNTTATAAQVQSTVQALINDNDPSVGTNWTAKYLDGNGNAIGSATFSGSAATAPPGNSCGAAVSVTGTWSTSLARVAGVNSASATANAGAIGGGSQGVNLAVASLLPDARHTIYAGAIGKFKVRGSMFDNSIDQCNGRYNSCAQYPQCLTGTPTNNIVCYADSIDLFQSATVNITGTLYSHAPVSTDPCFYPSPPSGTDPAMTAALYPAYYNTYGCGSQFSNAPDALTYGGIQGNSPSVGDPLANLPDPSGNSGAATECPGATSVSAYNTSAFSSGTMSPGVYNNPVIITGSVTLNPCMSGSTVTGPGIYVFKKGVEICPPSGSTVSGTDVMLFASAAPSSTYSNATANNNGYCVPAPASSGTAVADGIHLGGAAGASVMLTGPDQGVYKGILLYQSRSVNLNIGLDNGWTQAPGAQICGSRGCRPGPSTYTSDGATITLNGVVYDNSYRTEPADEVFSAIGSSYAGPYGSLCAGSTAAALIGDPVPCPGIPSSTGIGNTSGNVTINGAVIVGAFGTMGGTNSNPMALTINFDGSGIALSAGNLRLLF